MTTEEIKSEIQKALDNAPENALQVILVTVMHNAVRTRWAHAPNAYDEAPKKLWDMVRSVNLRLKPKPLQDADDLQLYFSKRRAPIRHYYSSSR